MDFENKKATRQSYGEAIAELGKENKNVVAIKEASGNIDQVKEIAKSKALDIYSGNDDQILPTLSVGGLGVIENDFHNRKDLTPNVCAVYIDETYRRNGIAGKLLDLAVEDLRNKGISPVYLLTDHIGFYERYGWEFHCMAQGEGEAYPSRMYIHR